ncbi:MAG: helix-turn-helix domain-containing protein [Bacteroidales bacterium]|jgi:excisionase family DNA binding protein
MIKENLTIEQRLDNIENLLIGSKEVLTFEEFCNYCGISKSFGYKLTARKEAPHYCRGGKMLYFSKAEIDNWLLQNPIKTTAQIEQQAATYVTLKNKGINKK